MNIEEKNLNEKPHKMKKIIIAVTGGIAAYKSLDIITCFKSKNYEIRVISTDSAHNYVTTNALNVISGGNHVTESPGETKHIDLAKWCDAFIMVPATANTIAKMSNGLADNLVLTTFLALPKDKLKFICPAMNTQMYENPITQDNIKRLYKVNNMHVIEPVIGMLACGDKGIGKLPNSKFIVETITDFIENFPIWSFPLESKKIGSTDDSFSFLDFDWKKEVQIPIGSHVGSFGIRRRHDVHKGIDLYAEVGAVVSAVEDGVIVDICAFTGEVAGFPFWENTWGIYVKGKSGIVVYGEIKVRDDLKIGDGVYETQWLGTVLTVLKKDNGRPRSMLHMELHEPTHIHTEQWEIGKEKPEGILDPTKYLLKSIIK